MDQIIHARLIEPALPSALVANRPLIEELKRAVCSQRITFLHAPSGYGKTVAMCELGEALRQEGHSTSWLSIDPALSDAVQFWAHTHASFVESGFCPGVGNDELAGDGGALADILVPASRRGQRRALRLLRRLQSNELAFAHRRFSALLLRSPSRIPFRREHARVSRELQDGGIQIRRARVRD